jgi:hypothetical protein
LLCGLRGLGLFRGLPLLKFESDLVCAPCRHGKMIVASHSSVNTIVDVMSSDIWSRIGRNASQRDQSHANTRHKVLDWFGPSHGVIALRPVLMYYAIEIGSSLFLSGSFGCPSGFSSMWIYPLYL